MVMFTIDNFGWSDKMSAEIQTQPEQNKKNWYKNTWCVVLFLIIFYPVGLILLWLLPQRSAQLKGLVTIVVVCSAVYFNVGNSFLTRFLYPPPQSAKTVQTIEYQSISTGQSDKYVTGYLKQGSAWKDKSGKAYYNTKRVKVEIWNRKIVMADGSKTTQIYFLEGEHAGEWGYAREEFLSR